MSEAIGTLYLVATPIGNLGDMTLRALETLKTVDFIAAEDTRHTRKLLNHYAIEKTVTSYFEHNKKTKGPILVEAMLEGKDIALVSDAGMPGISDPGADLVQACIQNSIPVTAIPGASAVITALVASGLDTTGFLYAGFFPRGKKERGNLLSELQHEKRTLIFYESPHRLKEALEMMLVTWGDRRCCVARELTKIYEEYLRGTLSTLGQKFEGKTIKGEITLLVEGQKKVQEQPPTWEALEEQVNQMMTSGLSKKEAVKETARLQGVSKRELYNRLMR